MRGRCGFAGGWALRRDEDPFRHPACGRRRVTPPPEGEARAWVRIRPESPHRQPPRGRSAAATSPGGGGKGWVRIRRGIVLERRGIPPGRRGRRPLRRRRGLALRAGATTPPSQCAHWDTSPCTGEVETYPTVSGADSRAGIIARFLRVAVLTFRQGGLCTVLLVPCNLKFRTPNSE